MFILTFANKVRAEGKKYHSKENTIHYRTVRNDMSLKIKKILCDYKVQEEVADAIPVIPVGLVQQPNIPSDDRGKSWVEEFWDTVHKTMKVS